MKDLLFVNEATRGVVFRYYGIEHPFMHPLADKYAEGNPTYQKMVEAVQVGADNDDEGPDEPEPIVA